MALGRRWTVGEEWGRRRSDNTEFHPGIRARAVLLIDPRNTSINKVFAPPPTSCEWVGRSVGIYYICPSIRSIHMKICAVFPDTAPV